MSAGINELVGLTKDINIKVNSGKIEVPEEEKRLEQDSVINNINTGEENIENGAKPITLYRNRTKGCHIDNKKFMNMLAYGIAVLDPTDRTGIENLVQYCIDNDFGSGPEQLKNFIKDIIIEYQNQKDLSSREILKRREKKSELLEKIKEVKFDNPEAVDKLEIELKNNGIKISQKYFKRIKEAKEVFFAFLPFSAVGLVTIRPRVTTEAIINKYEKAINKFYSKDQEEMEKLEKKIHNDGVALNKEEFEKIKIADGYTIKVSFLDGRRIHVSFKCISINREIKKCEKIIQYIKENDLENQYVVEVLEGKLRKSFVNMSIEDCKKIQNTDKYHIDVLCSKKGLKIRVGGLDPENKGLVLSNDEDQRVEEFLLRSPESVEAIEQENSVVQNANQI